jgi:signal transduction histidine kinase
MKRNQGLPGQWIWVVLVVALALLAVLRVLVEDPQWRAALGERFYAHAGWLVAMVVALSVGMLALVARVRSESGSQPALDRAFMMLVLSWVISTAGVAAISLTESGKAAVLFLHLAYQFSVAASFNFLRTTVSHRTRLERSLLLMQLLVGSGFLVWDYLVPQHHDGAVLGWRLTNVVAFAAIFLVLSRSLLADSRYPPWLPLGACLMGFGVGLSDMASVSDWAIQVTPMHNVYSSYLLMIWLLLTNRLGRLYVVRVERRELSENSILGGEFAHTDLDERRAPDDIAQGRSDAADTRRRIAQELHDGVGSQLVNILAALDRNQPHERSMADALEQCLLDVKILVDDIDSSQECVLDALARLRYRVQSSLDRLGIRLHWDLREEGPLSQVCDERSRQVLRIAQEALANVMRHSRARNVSFSCRYFYEAEAMVLDILDDGIGFDSRKVQGAGGKGLQGMRRRAESIHAELLIRSKQGSGTTVRLLLPVDAPSRHIPRVAETH